MNAPGAGIPPSVGQVVHRLRRAKNLTLEELARRSGVSKSMLSQIERNRTNPTFATIWRLTNALGVGLDEVIRGEGREPSVDVVAAHATPSVSSADGRCRLRILGPLDLAGLTEWYEMMAEPDAELVSEAHDSGTTEHLRCSRGAWWWKAATIRAKWVPAKPPATLPTRAMRSAIAATFRRGHCWLSCCAGPRPRRGNKGDCF